MLNKPCSIDLGSLFLIGTPWESPRGWFGKSMNNLPSKIMVRGERNFPDHKEGYAYIESYRYETDSKGYVTKIFLDLNNDSDGEFLYIVINYQ